VLDTSPRGASAVSVAYTLQSIQLGNDHTCRNFIRVDHLLQNIHMVLHSIGIHFHEHTLNIVNVKTHMQRFDVPNV